jgi:hypothetical protein
MSFVCPDAENLANAFTFQGLLTKTLGAIQYAGGLPMSHAALIQQQKVMVGIETVLGKLPMKRYGGIQPGQVNDWNEVERNDSD